MVTVVMRDHLLPRSPNRNLTGISGVKAFSDKVSHIMNRAMLLPALLFIVAGFIPAGAQTTPSPAAKEGTRFTSFVEFGGTSNSDGQIYALNPSVGYNFNQHLAMDLGLPFFFVRPSSDIIGATSSNGFGNPYVDLRVKFLSQAVNFASVLTGYAPLGDSKKGLSTGRATFDWTNHVDRSFSRLTSFAEVGIANTVTDSSLFMRPFTTLGFNTHLQGGASYDIWKFFSVGASGYDILPTGQQTVFSKVEHGSGNPGQSSHGRSFQDNQQTTGSADIARDDGFSTWVEAMPSSVLDMQLGFTRSMHYDLNSVSFTIGLNLGRMYHRTVH